MNRTATNGLLCSILAAVVPGCRDEDFVCQLNVCGTGCVNVNDDPLHCGACFNECGVNEACEVGVCMPTELVCTAPEVVCDDACVNTDTSAAHCGTCDAPCTVNGDCVDGGCAEPLIALRTIIEDETEIGRDVFVIQDGTLIATRLGDTNVTGSRVVDHAVLPDGRVVLVAAQETENVFELWLSSPRGGALTKLSSTLVTDGDVLPGFAVSADGTKVLYRADQDVDEQIDLYAVSIANPGVTVKVNDALVTGGAVSRVFSLSVDGGRATYIADEDALTANELYTVDLTQATPGPSIKLNPTRVNPDADVFDFVATADASRVMYRSNDTVNGNHQLFVVDVATAGTAKPITNTLAPDYNAAEDYSLTPDGAAAIYTGGESFFEDSMFLSDVTVATPDSVFLVENAIGFDAQVRTAKAVAGGAVFFRQDVASFDTRLFTVDVATPNVVTPVFDPVVLSLRVDRVVVSPNGQHLVFGAGGDGGESGLLHRGTDGENPFGRSFELYHVDLTAALPAVPTRIAESINKGVGIRHDYLVLDDGRVIFRADLDTGGTTEVYVGHPSVPDTVVKISPPLDQTTDASDVRQLRRF